MFPLSTPMNSDDSVSILTWQCSSLAGGSSGYFLRLPGPPQWYTQSPVAAPNGWYLGDEGLCYFKWWNCVESNSRLSLLQTAVISQLFLREWNQRMFVYVHVYGCANRDRCKDKYVVVLSWDVKAFYLLEDIWQCLEIFVVVSNERMLLASSE